LVTDSKGCTITQTVSITQPTALTATITSTNETCDYLNNGTANASVSGGTPAYTYTWLPGNQSTASISGQAAGTYTVIIKDSKGCSITSFATITQPTTLSVTTLNAVNVSCNGGNNGSVSANASGGTPNYTYSWLPGGQTGTTATNLGAGTYTVTVTDANSCNATNTVTITQPPVLTVTATIANVSCAGGSNGSVTATPSGGTSPYTYLWSPVNQTSATAVGLTAGVYTVTVTDSKGCTVNGIYTVTQPSPLSVTVTPAAVSCFGGNNGGATATAGGGTPAYSYSWSPSGGSAATANSLTAGTYTVLVTDSKGCATTQTTTITQPTALTATTSVTNETCDYLNNGSASVTASGGTPAYTYTWQPGNLNGTSISGQASGTYTVTIKDTRGCLLTATAIINQPAPLAITFTNQTNVSCFGGNNGSITGIGSGGTPNYTYSWMPGSLSGATINNLAAGTYTLTLTDAHTCTKQSTITITQPVAPVSVAVSSFSNTCHGGSNGSVSANASGGTGPYSYSWMPGNLNGSPVNNLPAGTYTVTATDSKGCTQTNTVTVTQPPSITITTSAINSTCGNSNGQASASASGGVGPYTYTWMPGGVASATITGVPSGSYSVNVNDANGCFAMQIQNVNDNTGPSATIFGVTDVTCNGGSNGSATVAVVGGAGTISYTWSPLGGNGPVATGLPAGTYVVLVQDSNGCQALATTSPGINQPPPISIAVSVSNVSCFAGNNGTASASATGGTGAFSYLWLPSNTSGATISGLSAGTYTVQATDANNCVQTQTFVVTQPSAALSVAPSSTPVSCFGGTNGAATATAAGGTSPYSYTWLPGNFSGQNISQLPAGTYTVNVSDNHGCTTSNTVAVTQPTSMTLALGSVNSTCGSANGTASVSATGGTPAYSYSWTPTGGTASTASGLNAGTYYVQVTDNNGCISTQSVTVNNTPGPTVTVSSVSNVSCNGGSNGTATSNVTGGTGIINYTWTPVGGNNPVGTGLSAGVYTVTIKDQNNCSSVATATITEPPTITVSVLTASTSCFGGSNGTATVLASGGTPGFTYLWFPSGSSGSTIGGLSANNYTVQAADTHGCIATQTFVIGQPTQLTATTSGINPVSCFGGSNGSVTVNAGGGTPFYTYTWTPSGGNGPTASGLTAGTYTANITDSKGCTTFTVATITQPAQALTATSSANGASCFGGSNGTATVTANGGTPGYTYTWSPSGGNSASASGLSSGTYIVVIQDANGCNTNISLTISQGTPITGSLAVTNPSCGFNNGSIVSQISGGTSPYSYSWSPGGASTANISGVGPGNYSVLITDALNCTQSFSTTLTNIPGPSLSVVSTTSVSCFGGNNGAATINVTQGTNPYTISWSPYGGGSATAGGLTAGTYTATVVDALGCISSITATINQPTAVTLGIVSSTNVSCNGGTNGAATVGAAGGTPNYTYSWNPNVSSGSTASNLSAGNYTATVHDQNGCSTSIPVIISQPAVLASTLSGVSNAVCFNSTGSATVTVSGGTAPYTYSWNSNPVQTGNVLQGVNAGTYSVNITDAQGCTTQNQVTITQPAQIVTSGGINDTVCVGQTGTLQASASGGSGNYYYTWEPGAVTNSGTFTVNPNVTTHYTVVAFDQNGCAGNPDTVSVIYYTLGPANVQAHGYSPICPGHSSTIYVSTTGVTGPLTYTWSNNLGNGPGAYLVTPTQSTTYYVSVHNACGSTVTDSVQINLNPQPTIVLVTDTNKLCAPGIIHFNDQSITGNVNDPITSWYWSFGDGSSSSLQNPTHSYSSPGTYSVTLSVGTNGGCASTNSSAPYIINAYPHPVAIFSVNSHTLNLPYDSLICINSSQGTPPLTYNWSFGDGGTSTVKNPHYLYNSVGNYLIHLTTTNAYGCTDDTIAEVTTVSSVVFPNAFTPNPDGPNGGGYTYGDLTNDVFFPYTSGVTEFKLQIFNRWGELIFESLDVKQGWDGYYHGKLCQQDVYVWKAFLKFNNGKTFNKTGDVTLLR
jgi:gliding motility-associated-like protein